MKKHFVFLHIFCLLMQPVRAADPTVEDIFAFASVICAMGVGAGIVLSCACCCRLRSLQPVRGCWQEVEGGCLFCKKNGLIYYKHKDESFGVGNMMPPGAKEQEYVDSQVARKIFKSCFLHLSPTPLEGDKFAKVRALRDKMSERMSITGGASRDASFRAYFDCLKNKLTLSFYADVRFCDIEGEEAVYGFLNFSQSKDCATLNQALKAVSGLCTEYFPEQCSVEISSKANQYFSMYFSMGSIFSMDTDASFRRVDMLKDGQKVLTKILQEHEDKKRSLAWYRFQRV